MLLVSLDCLFLIAPCFVCLRPVSCVPNVASVSGLSILDCPLFCLSSSCVDEDKQNKGQSSIDNPEKLATLGTQDTGRRQTKQGAIKNRQSRDTSNIRNTRHRTKTNKTRVSLDCLFLIAPCFVCPRPVSCVPNVASVSGLSILDCPLFCLSSSCVLCT
jgi:hypothetical protein